MTKIKLRRPSRIVHQTSDGGLVLIQQQFAKYTPFKMIFEKIFQKRFGLSILSLWIIMIIRSILGGSSFQQFAKEWNKDSTKGIITRYRKEITHRLLARNIHRFSPQLTRKIVIGTAKSMFQEGLLTAKRIAIDSSSIEISGSKFPKVGSVMKNGKYITGYKLSIAFDIDAKVPLAYILTPLNVHDSQLLISLINIVQKEYNSSTREVVLDRGYYGADFFKFLNNSSLKFFIPAKKYSPLKKRIQQLNFKDFHYLKKLKHYYKDERFHLKNYATIRCIFIVSKQLEDWMPPEEKENHIWAIYTNDFTKSPGRIIQTYRDRWQIEVFFKEIKNGLGLTKLPGRDYRIIQMHIGTVLLAYLCLTSLVLEDRLENESISIAIKNWKNQIIYLVLTIYLRGTTIFLEFQEKWVTVTKTMEEYLNGGISM